MDGSGPGHLGGPPWTLGARLQREQRGQPRHSDQEEVASWKPGDTLPAQRQDADRPRCRRKRIPGHAGQGEKLPVDFTNRVIYYVGPVDPVQGRGRGPGPLATRMDGFTELMLAQTGLIAMVRRRPSAAGCHQAIKTHRAPRSGRGRRHTWSPKTHQGPPGGGL